MYVNDVQAKIIILYAMQRARLAITVNQLSNTIITDDILDYFSLMHYFYDLIDYGYIKQLAAEENPKYEIQDKGLEAVSLFYDKIPHNIRRKLERRVDSVMGLQNKVMDIRTGTALVSDGQIIAKCGIYEWNKPLLEINIMVGSQHQANQVARYFEQNATDIYQKTFETLGLNLKGEEEEKS